MTRQYETCDHRYDTKNPDAYCLTPCPICEYEEDQKDKVLFIACVAGVVVVIGFGAFVMGLMS